MAMELISKLLLVTAILGCLKKDILGKISCPGAVVTKVGCFADNYQAGGKGVLGIHPIPELLFTDHEPGSKKFSGVLYPNKKLTLAYIRGYICRCARNTLVSGSSMFGLQHYGECWSGKKAPLTYKKHGRARDCITDNFKKCGNKELCIGEDNANFVFTARRQPYPTRPRPSPQRRPLQPTRPKTTAKPTSAKPTSQRMLSTPKPTSRRRPSTPKPTPSKSTQEPSKGPKPSPFPPVLTESQLINMQCDRYVIGIYFEENIAEQAIDQTTGEFAKLKAQQEYKIKEIYKDYKQFNGVRLKSTRKATIQAHRRLQGQSQGQGGQFQVSTPANWYQNWNYVTCGWNPTSGSSHLCFQSSKSKGDSRANRRAGKKPKPAAQKQRLLSFFDFNFSTIGPHLKKLVKKVGVGNIPSAGCRDNVGGLCQSLSPLSCSSPYTSMCCTQPQYQSYSVPAQVQCPGMCS